MKNSSALIRLREAGSKVVTTTSLEEAVVLPRMHQHFVHPGSESLDVVHTGVSPGRFVKLNIKLHILLHLVRPGTYRPK